MISAKKIRTLKPRVQLRRAADVFHEAAASDPGKEYLDEILSIVLSSDLVDQEDAGRIKRFYSKGKGIGYEDIHYALLSILGDSPADWDKRTEEGEIDWSARKKLDHYLFLDHLRSPYNVGAIFRSAAALGMDAVLVTPTCCDPLYRRSARVSMGTVFQIPWTRIGDDPSQWPQPGLSRLNALGFRTVAMALSDTAISVEDPRLRQEDKLAIVLGTEGDGLSAHTIAACDYTVCIPMSHGVDSLNVAAASAVAFWELRTR